MKKAVFNVSALTALLVPAIASAQNTPQFAYVDSWVNHLIYWLKLSITVITILLTVFFLWSVLVFIMDKGEKPEDTTKKRKAMINGLIGLFVSAAVWGIIALAGNVAGVSTNGSGDGAPAVTCPPGLVYNPSLGVCN